MLFIFFVSAAKGSRTQSNNDNKGNVSTTDNYRIANIEADLIYNFLIQTSAISASTHRPQRNSVLENSLDLRLANEILGVETTTAKCGSDAGDTPNDTSLSLLPDTNSSLSYKEKTSSPTSKRQQSLFHRHGIMQTQKPAAQKRYSGSEHAEFYASDLNSRGKLNSLHSREKGKHFFACGDFDSENGDLERARELNSDMSCDDGDTDWETDEVDSDSLSSCGTKKCIELMRGNPPLLSDKLFTKHGADNKNSKSRNTPHNIDGLLSIALKTIKLVKRNQLLQQRLTQLQVETTDFIQSVLANPENHSFRENIKQKV